MPIGVYTATRPNVGRGLAGSSAELLLLVADVVVPPVLLAGFERAIVTEFVSCSTFLETFALHAFVVDVDCSLDHAGHLYKATRLAESG